MRQAEKIIGKLKEHRPSLVPPGVWDDALDRDIAALAEEGAWRAVKAGLHLWNDSLDLSHTLSQSISDRTGSYWHGIMHRMEPDYDNARYWFRRVPEHPAFADVHRVVADYLHDSGRLSLVSDDGVQRRLEEIARGSGWQPLAFIDAVERHRNGRRERDRATEAILEEIQFLEIECLLGYCTGTSVMNGGSGS